MPKHQITRFFVNEAGQIEVLDFHRRTFKQALKPFLKKGWKKDPGKLVKAMHRSSDLREAVIVIRDAYLDHFNKLTDELITRLCDEPQAQSPSAAEQADLEDAYKDLLAVTVLLTDISTKSLTNWVHTLAEGDYGDLVEELRIFLLHEVTPNFHVWDAAVDTPEGQAVTLLMDLAPDDQEAFGFELVQDEEASSLCYATTRSVDELNAIAHDSELNIEFRASRAEPSKAAEAGDAAEPAQPKAAKPEKAQKAAKTQKPAKAQKAPKPRKTVKALKSAKKPAAAGENAAKAAPKAGEKAPKADGA